MTNYQLAKLIQMAGGKIESRKRIQKIAHLLQCAGCPFGLHFPLHYYGPYSAELAQQLDLLSYHKVFIESVQQTKMGNQYDYTLSDEALDAIKKYEETPCGRDEKAKIERFCSLLEKLNKMPLRTIEIASTVAAFYEMTQDWEAAQKEAAEFKGEEVHSLLMREACKLAKEVFQFRHVHHGENFSGPSL